MSARPASLLPSSPDEPKVFTASKKTLSGSYQRQYDDQLEISRSHDHRHFEYLPIGGDLLGSDRIVRNGLVYNLRDLGGYRTRSGAYVRNGVLFRSSSVGNAPVELLVEELNVWTVVDLRTVEEALHTGYSEELSEVFPNKAANVRAFAEPDKRAMFFVPLISRLRAVQFLLSKGSCVDKTYACKSYFRIVP